MYMELVGRDILDMETTIKELSTEETNVIRKRLEKGLQNTLLNRKRPVYWYPLFKVKSYVPVLAFDADFFNDDNRMQILGSIIQNHGINEVFQFREFTNGKIIPDFVNSYLLKEDEDGFDLPYASECYLFDRNKDWLIYTSHEHTIALAGDWLINEIKTNIPDYSEGLFGRGIYNNEHKFIYHSIHASDINIVESTLRIRKMLLLVQYLKQQRNNLFVNHEEHWLEITLVKTRDFSNVKGSECDEEETNCIHIVTQDNLTYANDIEEMLLGIAYELGWEFN